MHFPSIIKVPFLAAATPALALLSKILSTADFYVKISFQIDIRLLLSIIWVDRAAAAVVTGIAE